MRLASLFNDAATDLGARCGAIYAILIGMNLAAWTWAFLAFAGQPILLGTALLAYLLGLRHAVDTDHIAAIDNVIRQLMEEDKRPIATGFFFSLGHSTIVIIVAIVVTITVATFHGDFGVYGEVGSLIGTGVSSGFLLLIGASNLVVLRTVWRTFRRSRTGTQDQFELERQLGRRGGLIRFLRPLLRMIRRSWQMYPLGFLFGLGFDTASEVALLSLSVAQAASSVSWWSALVFPALFTSGMALIDTTDSVLMVGAYRWAAINPTRKLWYNLTITTLSVVIALLIGGIEAAGLIVDSFGLNDGIWKSITDIGDKVGGFGMAMIGMTAVAWGISYVLHCRRNPNQQLTTHS